MQINIKSKNIYLFHREEYFSNKKKLIERRVQFIAKCHRQFMHVDKQNK